MKIAEIAPEVFPFSKTGGLADVVGSLPIHLAGQGADVVVITPGHRTVKSHTPVPWPGTLRVPMGDRVIAATVTQSVLPGSAVKIYFIEHPDYFDRDGLYGTPEGDYPDNAARFVFFSRAALELLKALGVPDVVHVHDWQAGLIPAYLKTLLSLSFPKTKTVLTIHNLAYQGLFPSTAMGLTGLDWGLFNWKQLEFYGQVSFLKAGIVFADAVTTVSPTYAREIQEPEMGCGFDGILKDRGTRVHGILNGVDYREWNPETDRHIPAPFTAAAPEGKAASKKELQRKFGLEEKSDVFLISMIGRLAEQKGLDIFCDAAEELVTKNMQIAILGSGDPRFQARLKAIAGASGGRVAVQIGFNEGLAHLMESGADAFLMPSRYEPCGLNQIYSLKYGTVPIVRKTGGLADTVVNATPGAIKKGTATGFVFEEYSPEALVDAVGRALKLYKDRAAWMGVMQAGMKQDFSWTVGAKKYLELFASL